MEKVRYWSGHPSRRQGRWGYDETQVVANPDARGWFTGGGMLSGPCVRVGAPNQATMDTANPARGGRRHGFGLLGGFLTPGRGRELR